MYDVIIVNRLNFTKVQEFVIIVKALIYDKLRNLFKMFTYCEFIDKNWDKSNSFKTHLKFNSSRHAKILIFSQLTPITAMIIRFITLLLFTGFSLYGRWLLMGSTLPVFQEIDNPASFQENFFDRVCNFYRTFKLLENTEKFI